MIQSIQVKLDVIESMLYFWQATNGREKVGEQYIYSVVDRQEMKSLYDDAFTRDSARKVMSAISNREILNTQNKLERKFWNNNMWMMEDLGYTDLMIKPIKTLNLDDQIKDLQAIDTPYETLVVHFVPGLHEVYKILGHEIFINFFRVKPDLMDPTKTTVNELPLKAFVAEKLKECIVNQ